MLSLNNGVREVGCTYHDGRYFGLIRSRIGQSPFDCINNATHDIFGRRGFHARQDLVALHHYGICICATNINANSEHILNLQCSRRG